MAEGTTGGASRGVEETRTYDADGHVLIDNQYYALGTMLGALPAHRVNPDDPDSGDSGDTGSTGTDVGGELDSATINYYDSVGRLAVAQTFGHASGWDGSDGGAAPTSAPGVDATTFGALSLQSEVVYQGAGGSAGYDADGDVVAYQYRDGSGRIDQYAVTYLRKDSYLQSTTSGENVSNTPNVRPSTDESVYDDRGNLVALTQHTQYAGGTVADTVRVFAYDGNGEIIERRDGTANGATLDQGPSSAHENQHYVYVNGQQVAHVDEGGTVDVLSEVTAFSSSTNGPNDYVVQGGDTLQSIAQAAYGDASLWYVIAQANALSSDSDLSIGQRLTIPQVTTNSNTATTVKPYDPSAVVGSTTPNLPIIAPPPPPPSHHCNALAEIIVIAVTVVATIATYGATTELLAGELGTLGTVGVGAIAGAAAGAVGSIAGQATGIALGTQNGFDLGQVAEGAIGGAIGGGITAELSSVSDFQGAAANGLNFEGNAIQGVANYLGNDVAAKITDQPAHFSWAGLVANSLGNAISGELGPSRVDTQLGLTPGSYLEQVGARAAGDVVDREASVALGDNHVQSFAQVGEDIAGYAIGNPIGHALGNQAVMAIQNYKNQQALNALNTSVNQSLNNEINGLNKGLANTTANMANQNVVNNGQLALSGAWQQQSDLSGANSALGAYSAAGYQQNQLSGEAWNQPQDMTHIDPQADLTVREDIAAEQMAGIGVQTTSEGNVFDATKSQVTLGTTELSDGTTGRVASTTNYNGTYVDPYLIARNDGQASWSNTVQTFQTTDETALPFIDTTPAAPAPIEQSGLDAELVAGRIAGAGLGIVAASVKAAVGLVVTAKTVAGAAGDELFGGYTNAFRADSDRLGQMVGAGVQFFENHPVDTTLSSLNSTLDRAAELSQSRNPLDQLESGMLIGETTTNVGLAVDGAAGLSRLGVAGVGALGDGAANLAGALGDVRFVGSGDGSAALAANSQLGAIGEDLSGFRPSVLNSVTAATADIATVEGGDVATIDSTARATVQQAVLGDVAESSTLNQFNTAYDFYSDAGYEGERLIGHLQGIDYSEPVSATQLELGTNYVQQVLNDTKGNYFADLGTPADTLGINLEGRVPTFYTPSGSVRALQSTAANIVDTWTVPGESFEAIGGGKQLFVPNKQLMIEVPSARADAAGTAGVGGVNGAGDLGQLRTSLQATTNQAVTDLTVNPGLAQGLMSPGSYDQLVNGTNLAPASFGKAVERLTAQYVQADPLLANQFEYLSAPFVSTPDFAGTVGENTYTFDITTDASVASHLTRSYGPTTTYITYPGLPPRLVFPK